MTREEAIKAARTGKTIKHVSSGPLIWLNDALIYLHSGDYFSDSYSLESEAFDDFWEIVKQKVKKTFWIVIGDDFSPNHVNTAILYPTKEQAERTYPSHYGNKHIPVEIEVEE